MNAQSPLRCTQCFWLALTLSLTCSKRSDAGAPGAAASPLFRFGVVADIQYGDKETSGGTSPRQYRRSLELLPGVVERLNAARPAFVVHCGDLIDGYPDDEPGSRTDLLRVLPPLRLLHAPSRWVIGNHCLRAGRDFLMNRLGLGASYYEFQEPAAPGWRFLVVDGNDAGYGVVSAQQVAWLKTRVDQAACRGARIIVFCHYPVFEARRSGHSLRNAAEILEAIESRGCVVAWIAGHHHAGSYILKAAIHHLTLKGMIESPGEARFALFDVFHDRIRVDGSGDEPDRELSIVPAPALDTDPRDGTVPARSPAQGQGTTP